MNRKIQIMPETVHVLKLRLFHNDKILGVGTGFCVLTNHGYALITNRHNLTGVDQNTRRILHSQGGVPNKIVIRHNSVFGLGLWERKTEAIYNGDDEPLWIQHPEYENDADVVLLPLTSIDNVAFYPQRIETLPEHKLRIVPGEVASVIGFPFGGIGEDAFAIWATGFIATEIDLNYNEKPVFLIDCRTRPGQSGSVVIAHREGGAIALENGSAVFGPNGITQFLGVYSGRINAESDIGMVWKTHVVQSIIQRFETEKLRPKTVKN